MNYECPNCHKRIMNESGNQYCPICGESMNTLDQEISSPLASIIKRAMESKPTGPLAAQREKMAERMKKASTEVVIVADNSGSMTDLIGSLGMTKHEHLEVALNDIKKSHPKARVILFHSDVWEMKGSIVPMPMGGTNLAGALEYAKKFKPRKTIVISDGVPDDEFAAKEAADSITGTVDTIYCGPDEHPAIAFLRSLSHATGGTSITWDGRAELAANIRGLLPSA